jgi:hypothetical protein
MQGSGILDTLEEAKARPAAGAHQNYGAQFAREETEEEEEQLNGR